MFGQPATNKEFNEALRDALDITARGMLVREPETGAGFRNQVAEGIVSDQTERFEISKDIDMAADIRDLQMLDEKGSELELFVGNFVPAEVAVYRDDSIPTIARWDAKTQ